MMLLGLNLGLSACRLACCSDVGHMTNRLEMPGHLLVLFEILRSYSAVMERALCAGLQQGSYPGDSVHDSVQSLVYV